MSGRPFDPFTLRSRLANKALVYQRLRVKPSSQTIAVVVPELIQLFACSWESFRFLFGVASLAQLTDAQVLAARDWLSARPDDKGSWQPDQLARVEADKVNHLALVLLRELERGGR